MNLYPAVEASCQGHLGQGFLPPYPTMEHAAVAFRGGLQRPGQEYIDREIDYDDKQDDHRDRYS